MKDNVKIYAKTVEETAKQQIVKLSESDAYKDCEIRIMPDVHAGAGCTIGTVIAIRDRIVPNTVGVDIGCGMLVTELGKADIDLQKLDDVIHEKVPSGFNIHDEKHVNLRDSLMQMHCREVVDVDIAERSIGTLGGGNHFIEVAVDDESNKYLVIHSGSRNLGVRVCKYYQNIAINYCKGNTLNEKQLIEQLKSEGRQREIQTVLQEEKRRRGKVDNDLAYLEGDGLKNYLFDMGVCQRYADLNRVQMSYSICTALNLDVHFQWSTIHNYIDIQHNILRKGAVSALNNERLIIPMNMRDGSLICRGKGNIDWLYSAPHGAGRLMSRKKAIETLSMADFQESMNGIYSTSICKETIDEAPMVYKQASEIMECIKDTVVIENVIRPIYNFKAKELVTE
ncbi:MAG: RtcB family protein [Bacteroidales bacterium]|nr:RtcB family protein [Bacteroidales bacterium]